MARSCDAIEATIAEVKAGLVQPTITVYAALQVVNWRTIKTNTRTKLTLVVLKEMYDEDDDGFVTKQKEQYRVCVSSR